jgi:UDP-N-acetylglucosamine 2-epimerase (non-hydrolysing)
MIKVLSIFGTRPEAIKMAPVVKELEKHPDQIISRVCVTAQHREMLDQVLALFEIIPDHDLNLMTPGQTLSGLTARVIHELDPVLKREKPDWVLVQGDTTTVMAGSLVAFYHQIKIGHVEAGLRTGDKNQPFPEEINRRITGVVADMHFAPTNWAANNLRREGVPEEQIIVTGNTVIDAVRQVAAMAHLVSESVVAKLNSERRRIVLITAHRRENFGLGMEQICLGLKKLAESNPDVQLVYPVHMNPNVQQPVHNLLDNIPNITLLPPVDYQTMVGLMKQAVLVITDSGGLQEEAPGLGVPVLVMRETTERPEGVEAGTVKLVGANATQIFAEANRLLHDQTAYQKMARAVNPYGDGKAAHRIVSAILPQSHS